eukprot:TRINITY_DN383_c0_g1_i1.p1 TRINITY_DN383_c0_g1~~TRINITY_DN383_c0_g1_i1.p1  ORF type:complete len:534 (+),score=131.71 TRINITY_DN383_c0_g1_i1:36-1637(+)
MVARVFFVAVLLAFAACALGQATTEICYVSLSGNDNSTVTCGQSQASPCKTIQRCLDLLDPSTSTNVTIELFAGTYSGEGYCNLTFSVGIMELVSYSGYRDVTINCEGLYKHLTISITTAVTYISGIKFTGGMVPRSNDTTAGGGAITVGSSQITEFFNCAFEDNEAPQGGAIQVLRGSVKIYGCFFARNRADMGGAMYITGVQDTDSINVTYSNFTQNSAHDFGGAVWVNHVAWFDTVHFQENSAMHGGALNIYNTFTQITVINSYFTLNNAYGDGGAIRIYSDAHLEAVQIHNVYITQNNAGNTGGGIHAESYVGPNEYSVSVRNTSIVYNTAVNGGGISFRALDTALVGNPVMNWDDVHVVANTATGRGAQVPIGGGIFLQNVTAPFNIIGMFLRVNIPDDRACFTTSNAPYCSAQACRIESCDNCVGTCMDVHETNYTCLLAQQSQCVHGQCWIKQMLPSPILTCACESNYKGDLCDATIPPTPDRKKEEVEAAAIVVPIVIVVLIVVGFFAYKYRSDISTRLKGYRSF